MLKIKHITYICASLLLTTSALGALAVPNPVMPAGLEPVVPVTSWTDQNKPVRAVLLCIHGLGLHKGTFAQFGQKMAAYGIPTYALDVRGFGEWQEPKKRKIDFDGALGDIKAELAQLKNAYPGKPVFILGESMGGAIALRATAMYPDLVAGLISSVPAGDRFHQTSAKLKVGLTALFGGMDKPMKMDKTVVDRATQREDLRQSWESDPLARMNLTPRELIEFQGFMQKNFVFAKDIKDRPVLFIQGANDKLVRPEGTWQLCESLSTPRRELVLSKTAEHLIIEEGQFSKQDLAFVEKWIDKNSAVATASTAAPTASDSTAADASNAITGVTVSNGVPQTSNTFAATQSAQTPLKPPAAQSSKAAFESNVPVPKISYWIELYRDGKVFRCNNKSSFKSGDAIRFHIIPKLSGYAYLMMKHGTTGRSATLFPTAENGTDNFLAQGKDYAVPTKTWLKFDGNPGMETLTLFFAKEPIAPYEMVSRQLVAYISPERTGAKDIVPTRMRLSWDNPDPLIVPDNFSGATQLGGPGSSLVNVSSSDPLVALDIALAHH